MKLATLVTGFFCLFFSVAPAHAGQTTLQYHYDFGPARGAEWEGRWEKLPGYPMIPVVTARVLLPYGTELRGFEFVRDGEAHPIGRIDLPLAPLPHSMCGGRLSWPAPHRFSAGESYPSAVTGKATIVQKHGFRIAYIPLYPLQYYPESGEAVRATGGELRLTVADSRAQALFRGLRADREDLADLADHTEALSTYPVRSDFNNVDYLVIGPAQFLNDSSPEGLSKLLAEKSSRGITTTAWTTEEIQSQFSGKDLQEKIRNAIISAYKNDGIRYVLLVGNGYSITPTRVLHVNMSEGDLPSDFYYACLDGTFAQGKEDLACEVAVGRAPVSNLTEMRTFVAKTLQMQAISESDPQIWKALNFGEKLDDSTLGSKLIDKLITGGTAGSLSTTGYPSKASWSKMYESFSSEFSTSQVINALNTGGYYTVNHLGHANESYCMRFSSSNISQLTNPMPFFGITQGCHPGNLNGPNWASAMVLRPNGGAGAMVANSNYGFYDGSGSTDGPSLHYHLAFYDAVFHDGVREIGRAHYKGKEKLIPEVTTDVIMKWVVFETNLLGDPELRFKFPN